jgi:hypothetical protein
MSEFVTAAREELDRLEAELRADPRYEKLAVLRNLLAVYERVGSLPKRANGVGRVVTDTKKSAMEKAVSEFLDSNGGVAHRSAILDQLVARGIMGQESNQMAHLAAFLSDHRHMFTSDGRGNFRKAIHPVNALIGVSPDLLRMAISGQPPTDEGPTNESGRSSDGESIAGV